MLTRPSVSLMVINLDIYCNGYIYYQVCVVLQCFGLLGVNGAGKTTTFHMITGEVMPTAGAAMLDSDMYGP